MDSYSSGGEDLVIKTRKPYTITKQRERWTEEEHNRFLEALKLYGRAWQRIEEHIGTKTAVQIRSHAQKFFTKLEKEAAAKGVPIRQALDIEIPPPRRKRKPSNPYPRKTSTSPTTLQLGTMDDKLLHSASFPCCTQALDFGKEPCSEKSSGDERPTNGKESHNENCAGVFSLLQETHCPSVSAVNKASTPATEMPRESCTFREFVPSVKDAVNHDATNESYVTIDLEQNQNLDVADIRGTVQDNGTRKTSNLENVCPLHEKLIQRNKPEDLTGKLPTDDMQGMQNYPRHIPVHIIDGNVENYIQISPPNMCFQDSLCHPVGVHAHPDLYSHPAASTTTESHNSAPRSTHQPFPTFTPPVTPTQHNQDDYRSFLHMSSTFSSLIISTLLQNPAAHAAASFAATYWPYVNVESSADSPPCTQGGFPSRQSAPTMAALAATTVAAATAWWAAHGLLPMCIPLHSAVTHPPAPATAFQSADTGEVVENKSERKETSMEDALQEQKLDPEHSEAIQAPNSASKLPAMSSSDSEESGGSKPNGAAKDNDCEITAAEPDVHDSRKTKSKKQVDRSSCGSNTPSSSDVEIDALEKQEIGKEESKEVDANHPVAESTSRRGRNSSTNMNDSWKEVSELGRLAFQALFSREVLPQRFSPPQDVESKVCQKVNVEENKQNTDNVDGDALELDPNNKRCRSLTDHEALETNALPHSKGNEEDSLLTFALGHGKLKARRTGFKPYRRCLMEAKETMVMSISIQGDEKEPKRVRLEGEAST